MSEIVKSLVLRSMRDSPWFTRVTDAAELPVPIALADGELPVGWCRNPPPWEDQILIFTSVAMHVGTRDALERIAYDDLLDYETPRDKATNTGLTVRTAAGSRFIRLGGRFGSSGNNQDAFGLLNIVKMLVPGRGERRSGGPS
jgi:hypothetical protein